MSMQTIGPGQGNVQCIGGDTRFEGRRIEALGGTGRVDGPVPVHAIGGQTDYGLEAIGPGIGNGLCLDGDAKYKVECIGSGRFDG